MIALTFPSVLAVSEDFALSFGHKTKKRALDGKTRGRHEGGLVFSIVVGQGFGGEKNHHVARFCWVKFKLMNKNIYG